jgi:hypothetical protein
VAFCLVLGFHMLISSVLRTSRLGVEAVGQWVRLGVQVVDLWEEEAWPDYPPMIDGLVVELSELL